MIIKGSEIAEVNYRKGYDIAHLQDQIGHFAVFPHEVGAVLFGRAVCGRGNADAQ